LLSLDVLPRLTPEALQLGGVAKTQPADFEVEELPAYEPSGTGDHLFIWLQKTAMSANALLAHVSRSLGVKPRDIGCAGLKDTQAVTKQYLSVPAAAAPRLAELDVDKRVLVLGHRLHGNKLRTGHLRGNRFTLKIRNCPPAAAARIAPLMEHLRSRGLPNYFGSQRFGRQGSTLEQGLGLLRGNQPDRRGAPGGSPRSMHRLALSSVQSALFNRCVARRLTEQTLHRVISGEVMQVRASGGPFVVDDPDREQARFEAREIVGAGPMFGPKMRPAAGEMAAFEASLLEEAGLEMADFARHKKLLLGTRRANLIFFEDLTMEWDAAEAAVLLNLSLPPGTYATVLLDEIGCGSTQARAASPAAAAAS
jgi:tRNA pseudouridine13 synthase